MNYHHGATYLSSGIVDVFTTMASQAKFNSELDALEHRAYRELEMTSANRQIYLAFMRRSKEMQSNVFEASRADLRKLTGRGPDTLRKGIDWLIWRGLLMREPEKGANGETVYRLLPITPTE